MKFWFLLFTAILFYTIPLCAQQKDSLQTKEEENLPQNKKRKFLFFASDRMSEDGKYDIFKTIITEQNIGLMIARGHFEATDNSNLHRAKITVFNASTNNMVGIYNTDAFTGNYLLVLVPNLKYIFKIEASGYEVTEQEVEVPLKIDYEVCRQDIKIKRNEKGQSVVFINNFFSDGNEKVFFLKTSIDSTRKDAENAGYSDDESIKASNQKTYANVDEMVKKQLEEERKKPAEALKAFKAENFETALPIYEGLLKNDPKEPFLNYYYGVCLIKTNRNKSGAINHLEIASHYKEVPTDVFLYLGKAYQLSYMFADGYKALEKYKSVATPGEVNSGDFSQLMNNCRSGNGLMLEQINIEVLKRSSVDENNILAAYNPDQINDKLMYKTDFFNSVEDKKKSNKLLMCKVGTTEIIQVSYGAKEQNGTDLYKSLQNPDKTFAPSQSAGIEINTPYDENYPFVSKNGNTLYFSSKGHNSMGGFDIFMCTRTDATMPWSKPKNMGFPINSTSDDIMFVPDTSGDFASFCSNRKNGKLEFMQIKIIENTQPFSIIKGNFTTLDSVANKQAIITVFNSSSGEIAGVYKTNGETGNYLMALMSGASYNIIVEADGYAELSNSFVLPSKQGDFILKQTIVASKEGRNENIKVQNFFTEEQASKVVFEEHTKKPEVKKEVVAHKELKIVKPKRTPEENEKDEQNIKQARQLYEQATYQQAALIYQELELYIDLDAINSYYYGISLFYSKKDKYRCTQALDFASNAKDIPNDVFYYLGKANHLTYKFSAAIKDYKKFILLAKPSEIKKLQVEEEIAHCENGLKLVNKPLVLEVFEKKHVDLETIHSAFTHLESGAKIMVSTDDIRSSIDKKKNYKPVMYLSPSKTTIYFSSYGEDESNGKNIYRLNKLPGNKWSVPHKVEGINSVYDEEYPALSADGKILYFSSKGFDSMGGYDIYKCNWDENNQNWSAPINMGSPVNSPFDDIYYVE